MKNLIKHVVVVLPLLTLAACTEVPQEAVTLSVTVGEDIEELRRSHRAAVVSLFGRAKQDANRFIDDVYRPKVIKKFFDTFEFGGQSFVALLQQEIAKPGAGQTIDLMSIVVEEAMLQVDERRTALLEPIEAQEKLALKAIEDSYANVIAGQAAVTAHLASVRKVVVAQDEALADIGLADIRKKVIEKTAAVSDTVNDLLEKTGKVDNTIEKLEDIIGQAKEAWNKL